MKTLQQSLDFLLDKYALGVHAVLKEDRVSIDGKAYPLFAHRFERRLIELKNIVVGGTLTGVSVMRTARTVQKGADIWKELYRELDICQFVLDRSIRSIMAVENGNVLNVIARTEDGVVCTLEIAATLQAGEPPKDKHEIISARGIACDIVVDAQLRQQSVYLFGAQNEQYTDVDFELYGLSLEQAAIVRAAVAVAQNQDLGALQETDVNLRKLVALARQSTADGERKVL